MRNGTVATTEIPSWIIDALEFRKAVVLTYIEPALLYLWGVEFDENDEMIVAAPQQHGRRLAALSFLPEYVRNVSALRNTSMSFAALAMLFTFMGCALFIFMSCFYHNQKTSPLFISPRRHRLPKLVPPPLPVDGALQWVKVCFYMSDEEIINRIGFDSLIFLRFHRLALRCIVKMSVFSFLVLLPINFTGRGRANASDLKEYFGSLLFTDFMRFTMANVASGSPELWVHCFAAYLLTGIVVRELLVEYEAFHSIRHRYLLSREPHLRTVLVTNIPRHLRAPSKISTYFRHVYPEAVKSVTMCQNLQRLEGLIAQRTSLLTRIEQELLILCRAEKRKLFAQTFLQRCYYNCCSSDRRQQHLTELYGRLEELNREIDHEQRRRMRVMKKLDQMEAGDTARQDIAYILANPFVQTKEQYKVLGYRPPSVGAPRNSDGTLQHHTTHEEMGLRSRSPNPSMDPPESDGVFVDGSAAEDVERAVGGGDIDHNDNDNNNNTNHNHKTEIDDTNKKSKKRKMMAKAKNAIRRYSKLARNVNFFGRPVHTTTSVVLPSDERIEDHVNEVTDKAFVVMRTFTASTIAIQSMHSSKPGSMQVTTAPEPRDVLWGNIYLSKGAVRMRSFVYESIVVLIIAFYVIPIAYVALQVSESALVSSSARLAQLAQASAFFSSAIAMVQPLCIVGIQQLVPPLFIAISKAEGFVSFSEVQMRAFSRYFMFQVLNVFLVTTIAGSTFETIASILETPEMAFEILGNSLPAMSSFFITFITIKTFLGLGVELVRTMSLIQATLRFLCIRNPTLRMQRKVYMGMRCIDDPGWFPFHKILAQDVLVVVISVVFAVVAPLVLLPCALFCLFSRILWTHHHLYVYESVFETGGQFWPKIFRRFVFGLVIAQMTITGQFILKEALHEAYATLFLILLTYFFLRSTRARYDPSSSTLPLEVATVMDISLSQEEEALRVARERSRRAPDEPHSASDKHTQTTTSLPESNTTTDVEQDAMEQNLGALIGRYDPFKRAYLQPALRANPRARPEQPFPPNQLGQEQAHETVDEELVGSANATVRLKSLNQQDRRHINRWWNDQLQRCGDQNIAGILIGEECGTLAIGKRANLVEMAGRNGSVL